MNWENCLICLTNLEPHSPEVTETEENEEEGASVTGNGEALEDNLKVIFLLKNLCKVPNQKLEYYLENFGNPGNWAKLCEKCQKLIGEARDIWVNLLKAVKQFVDIRSKVIGKVTDLNVIGHGEKGAAANHTIYEDLRTIVNCGDYSKFSISYPFHTEKPENEADIPPPPMVTPKQEVIFNDFDENEEGLDLDPLSIVNVNNFEEDNYYEDNPGKFEDDGDSNDSDDYTPPTATSSSSRRQLKGKRGRPKKGGNLTCKFCGKGFPNEHGLSVHIGRSHSKEKDKMEVKEIKKEGYICEVEGCGKEYSWKQSYVQHMARHKNGRKFKCEICGKGFFRKSALQYHLEAHKRKSISSEKFSPVPERDKESHKIICTVDGCGMEFSWPQSYRMHMKKHKSGQRKFECEKCGLKFFRKSTLRYHMEAHQRNTIPNTLEGQVKRPGRPPKALKSENDPIPSDPSARVLEAEIIIREEEPAHEKFVKLEEGEEKFVCSVEGCGKVYQIYQRQQYRLHMARHRKETRFRCLICGKEFYKKANFLYHKGSHKRKGQVTPMVKVNPKEDAEGKADDIVPNYQCEYCGEKFAKKNYLTCHVKTHVPPGGPHQEKRDKFISEGGSIKKHVCDLCGKMFKEFRYLTKHVKFIHEKKWSIFCEICGKGMNARQHLRLHMRVTHKIFEEGVKLYKCPVEGCRKHFWDEGKFEEHMKEVHPSGEKGGDVFSYTCQHCGMGFWQLRNLNVHLKTHRYVKGKRRRNIVVKE